LLLCIIAFGIGPGFKGVALDQKGHRRLPANVADALVLQQFWPRRRRGDLMPFDVDAYLSKALIS